MMGERERIDRSPWGINKNKQKEVQLGENFSELAQQLARGQPQKTQNKDDDEINSEENVAQHAPEREKSNKNSGSQQKS